LRSGLLFAGVALEMAVQRGLPFAVGVSICFDVVRQVLQHFNVGPLACIERPDGV
jgi:hypothetical protein